MPSVLVNHCTKVNAPPAVLWQVLVDKVRRPDKYVPGVKQENVTVVQEFSELAIERKMTLGGNLIHEYINADPQTSTVVYKSMPNPAMRGFVTNTMYVEPGPDGDAVYLDYTMNWIFKDEGAPDKQAEMQESIRGAVEHTKKAAEEQAQK